MSFHNSLYDDVDEPDFYSDEYVPNKEYHCLDTLTAQEIYKRLDETVYGMDEVKRGISVFVYKALKGIHSEKCILIAAESGTGKSFLISELSKIVPLTIIDSSTLTPSGYKGSGLSTVLSKVPKSGTAFIVFDEFNRLLQKSVNEDSAWSDVNFLGEFLCLLDDKPINLDCGTDQKPAEINCKDLYIILIGSFSNLTDANYDNKPIGFCAEINILPKTHRKQITKEMILEHLNNYPELIGRINRILVNPDLTMDDYRQILSNPRYSPATKLEQELGLSIKIPPKKLRQYIKDCYESNTGVRHIRNELLEQVDSAIFDNPDVKEVIIK